MIRAQEKIPSHLPKKLTISFPIWALYDTGSGGAYHDVDKIMIEHRERGFNCMRFDDGAGLMHDINGNPRGEVYFGRAFGKYDDVLRQFGSTGTPGTVDLKKRLIDLFRAAKRHGVYMILSSWYYLHTFWFADSEICRELDAIPAEDRFFAFAKFLHYILLELEKEGLDTQVAFAEIFNEADGLHFVDGYGSKRRSDEEIAFFRKKHEEAIAWLKERHPQILFAYDTYNVRPDMRQIPENLEVFNFHNYFMWHIYREAIENDTTLLRDDRIPIEAIRAAAKKDFPIEEGWCQRAWFYNNLLPSNYGLANARGRKFMEDNRDNILDNLRKRCEYLKNLFDGTLSGLPIVSGEGFTYCGSYVMNFEEYSDTAWEIVAEMMKLYSELGLWGTVVRTCCGPEDPVWSTHPHKLLEMNRLFLENG